MPTALTIHDKLIIVAVLKSMALGMQRLFQAAFLSVSKLKHKMRFRYPHKLITTSLRTPVAVGISSPAMTRTPSIKRKSAWMTVNLQTGGTTTGMKAVTSVSILLSHALLVKTSNNLFGLTQLSITSASKTVSQLERQTEILDLNSANKTTWFLQYKSNF